MIVVSNTTPILSLYKIGRLGLLERLFGRVFVPVAVYNEISILGKGKPGHDVIDVQDCIQVKHVQNALAVGLLRSQLDYGEAEAIVLARELQADILMLDEKKARKVAQAGLQRVSGTIGILQAAKDKGFIPDMKSSLDALIANGIWVDRRLYRTILHTNGE